MKKSGAVAVTIMIVFSAVAVAWGSGGTTAAKRVKVVVECDRPSFAGAAKRYAHKPKSLDLRCWNGAVIAVTKWRRYGPRSAAGVGKLSLLAEGFERRYPVRFELRRPRGCRAAGGPIFTRIEYRFEKKRPRGSSKTENARFTCARGDIGY